MPTKEEILLTYPALRNSISDDDRIWEKHPHLSDILLEKSIPPITERDLIDAFGSIEECDLTLPEEVDKFEAIYDYLQTYYKLKGDSKLIKGAVSRDYFRANYAQHNTVISKQFGSWSDFKTQAHTFLPSAIEDVEEIKTIHRDDLFISKEHKISKTGPRGYFVSALIAASDVNRQVLSTVNNFCTQNRLKKSLLLSRGISSGDEFASEILDEFKEDTATEFIYNKHLRGMDFVIRPQQIIPSTGLKRFGQKGFSLIIASPKQFLDSVARAKGELPHLVVTTGTICESNYNRDRVGMIAQQDSTTGGLVVEIKNNNIFFLRHIQCDEDGGFQDLDTYYLGTTTEKRRAEALVLGDLHYPMEDPTAIKAWKEIVKLTNPKYILFHDLCDARSVNPHEKKSVTKRVHRPINQKTLENELNYVAKKMKEWIEEFPESQMVVVPSNHDNFIDRYLNDGDFVHDEYNVKMCAELLYQITSNEVNPLEYFIKSRTSIDSIKFLKDDESFMINEIELGHHGSIGANGSRGSAQSHELVFGKSTTGHTHAPQIFRDTWIVGTSSKLEMGYNKGGGSWLHASALHYSNGTRQMIISVNGQWHLTS